MNVSYRLLLIIFAALFTKTSAIEIIFNYDLDTTGFFDDADARAALEAAGAYYEELIIDELGAIDANNFEGTDLSWTPTYFEPGQQNQTILTSARNLVVPANSIVIYPGGRNLGANSGQGGPGGYINLTGDITWFNQVLARGEPGASTFNSQTGAFSTPTDFAPWGGVVFFNQNSDWNFSLTEAGLVGQLDFLSTALHEIGHVFGLGINGQVSPWAELTTNGRFRGPLAVEANGGVRPSLNNNNDHWASATPDQETLNIFGREHGESFHALMEPSIGIPGIQLFPVLTDLDIAALQDIGWEITATPSPFVAEIEAANQGMNASINFPSHTGNDYTISRGSTPDNLSVVATIDGDGSLFSWTDLNEFENRMFYQVEVIIPNQTSGIQPQSISSSASTETPTPSRYDFPNLPAVICSCKCCQH